VELDEEKMLIDACQLTYPPFVHLGFTINQGQLTHEQFYQQGPILVQLLEFVRMPVDIAHAMRRHYHVLI
jgi:hypothetical protein